MPNTYTNAKKDLTGTSETTLYTAPALTTAIVKSAPLVIKTGEILKVTAGNANRLHVVASILEIS